MKKLLLLTVAMAFLSSPAYAETVYCTNCSNQWVQAMERITNMNQLTTLMKEYDESIQQTAQQIRMVQQGVERFQNMLQNTKQLPQNMYQSLMSSMTNLARTTSQLQTQRADFDALGKIYDQLYMSQQALGNLVNTPSSEFAKANAQYQEAYDAWSKRIDEATRATFQLSGQQLHEMTEDSEKLQNHINNLLSTPEGQMQAIQAGNTLTADLLQETRQLRELMATKIQSDLAIQAKSEKEQQAAEENARRFFRVREMNTTPLPDRW